MHVDIFLISGKSFHRTKYKKIKQFDSQVYLYNILIVVVRIVVKSLERSWNLLLIQKMKNLEWKLKMQENMIFS